jgi:hypothetical protein
LKKCDATTTGDLPSFRGQLIEAGCSHERKRMVAEEFDPYV